MNSNINRTIRNLSTNLNNLLRYGTIAEVDPQKPKVRVQSGEIKTLWISWITLMAGEDRNWRLPSVGEYALILSPGGNFNLAVALVGIYYDKYPNPENNPETHSVTYSDGTKISYDKLQKCLSVNCIGSVYVQAKESVSVETQGSATVSANQGVSINSNSPISISTTSTISIRGAAGVSINAPGISMQCTGDANINCDGNVSLNARELRLSGDTPVARIGDSVQVQVTGGSSAGTYSGTITSGSDTVKAG